MIGDVANYIDVALSNTTALISAMSAFGLAFCSFYSAIDNEKTQILLLRANDEIRNLNEDVKKAALGDGFVYFEPHLIEGGILLSIKNDGKYPLYEVEAIVIDASDCELSFQKMFDQKISLGSFPPGAISITKIKLPFDSANLHLGFNFVSRSGFWFQSLKLFRVNGDIGYGIEVIRGNEVVWRCAHPDVVEI